MKLGFIHVWFVELNNPVAGVVFAPEYDRAVRENCHCVVFLECADGGWAHDCRRARDLHQGKITPEIEHSFRIEQERKEYEYRVDSLRHHQNRIKDLKILIADYEKRHGKPVSEADKLEGGAE